MGNATPKPTLIGSRRISRALREAKKRILLIGLPPCQLDKGLLKARLARRGAQLLRRAADTQPAVRQDADAVGKRLRLLEIMRGEDDGHSAAQASG